MLTLVGKLLRDVRLPLFVVCLLLVGFQCLWCKITQRITGQLSPFFSALAIGMEMSPVQVEQTVFSGPGKIIKTLMGGENIQVDRAMDMLSIGYVHPLMQTVFCIWAIGRAAGAVAGEIDRGTMELLLAQPLPRWRVLLAHLVVDALTIPILCLSLWAGTGLGTWLVGPIEVDPKVLEGLPPLIAASIQMGPNAPALQVYPSAFGAGLINVAALIFAVSGYTMWLSARGRFRGSVLGVAVFVTLLQFLINVVGQLWDVLAPLRPFTVFYYYQPQQIILHGRWSVDVGTVWNGGQPLASLNVLAVLFGVGAVGYGLAWRSFCRRDLPAPL